MERDPQADLEVCERLEQLPHGGTWLAKFAREALPYWIRKCADAERQAPITSERIRFDRGMAIPRKEATQ